MSLRPLLLAPALDMFTGSRTAAAQQVSDLTLNNVGPTLINLLGINAKDVMQLGITIAVLLVVSTTVVAGLSILGQRFLIRTRAFIVRDMTIALYRHLLTLSISFFHRQKTGDLVSRITQDVRRTGGALDSIVQIALKSIVQSVVTLILLFKTDVLFTLLVLGIGLLHVATNRVLGWRVRERSHNLAKVTGDIGAKLYESIQGIKTVKMFAAERYKAKHTLEKAENLTDSTIKHAMLKYYQKPIRMIIDALMASIVLVMAFYAVTDGRMTLAGAAMFFYLAQQLAAPLSELFSQGIAVKSMIGAAERIFEVFSTKNEIKDGTRSVAKLKDQISLRDVSFVYEDGTSALRNIGCEIKKGEFVGLVGPSGSGKTTFVDLILRLHDCTQGAVYFDEINIRDFQQRDYRRQFGIVAQDNILFNASVMDNVVFNRQLDEQALRHALWASNSSEFVNELSSGLQTMLGDRGVRLSGGQQQRIAIARAIYGSPSILVLDEATSALDTESERQVQEAIDRVAQEMTIIVIAHRLSTIRHADKVIVLNQGRIEAIGPHAEILSTSPTYKRLLQLQHSDIAIAASSA